NDTILNAGPIDRVGQNPTSPNIDPGAVAAPFAANADEDWYVFHPQSTNTFQVQIYWSEITTVADGRPGLPGSGDLSLDIFDARGNPIISGITTINPNPGAP